MQDGMATLESSSALLLKELLPYDPAMVSLGVCHGAGKTGVHPEACTRTFVGGLLVSASSRGTKPRTCSSG